MEIKIQVKDRIFQLCIGYNTNWFGQLNFISLSELWYDKMQVTYAVQIFSIIRRKS